MFFMYMFMFTFQCTTVRAAQLYHTCINQRKK